MANINTEAQRQLGLLVEAMTEANLNADTILFLEGVPMPQYAIIGSALQTGWMYVGNKHPETDVESKTGCYFRFTYD